jgi:hypothetical protein
MMHTAYELIRRVFLLFFLPKVFLKVALDHEQNADEGEMKNRISKLRMKIFRGLKIVSGAVIAALIANIFLKWPNLKVPHSGLLVMRIFGYSMVLWGVLSPVGHHIRSWDGNTLPEIVDEEWHRLAYLIGLFALLLSYLSE